MVYVINKNGKPLMPCLPVIARLLLKQKKAKCIRKTPFTIKLLYDTTEYVQALTLGIDTGSGKIGSSVSDINGNVIYLSEIELRNDITKKMTRRASYRRNRRNRKTRYRKARFLNRKNSIRSNRFSPTMRSKIDSHLKEINFVKSILPISKIILETATFDPHALKNPDVLKNKLLYQRGINYGFANTKAYVLNRDSYSCQNCKSKSKRLEVHHIQFRSENGSNNQENLITLCKECHDSIHDGSLKLKLKGKKKSQLKHATQMNSIRIQLLKLLPKAEETFGFVTKEHRQLHNLSKEHYVDAAIIATQGLKPNFKTKELILKRCISDGDYQQTKGVRSQLKIPTEKIQGFRKFDKVKYKSNEYFIKGRYSTGYAILMDINNKEIKFRPIPKFDYIKKISARKTCIVNVVSIGSCILSQNINAPINPLV